MLASYGYGLDITGVYDAKTEFTITAFQRHFRQARVDGIADPSTIATLSQAHCGTAGVLKRCTLICA